jgi:hypothetical protein
MADSSEVERGAETSRRARGLRTASALLFSFSCGVTSGVSWDYVVSQLL